MSASAMTSALNLHHTSRPPELCHVCSRRAGGLATGPKGDRWLCQECYPLLEYVRDVRRFDAYESRAFEAVDNAAGEYAGAIGKTDIAEFTDEERGLLWRTAVRAWGDGIRAALREGPF